MLDYIKPIIVRKPDVLLIHSGTNDLINNAITMKNVKDLVECVCYLDRNKEIGTRKLEKEISETNAKLRK